MNQNNRYNTDAQQNKLISLIKACIFISYIFLSGCVTTKPSELESEKLFTGKNALNDLQKEWVTRKNKDTGQPEEPQIGLALAGGGTRAAQYALGVLKGLYRSGVLEQVDVISSVSGGGYAAYGYLSRLLEQPGNTKKAMGDLFNDCIPSKYEYLLDGEDKLHLCPKENLTNVKKENNVYIDPYKSQNNLRSHIDLFSTKFSYETTKNDSSFAWNAFKIAVPQLLFTLATEPLTDFVFDWNPDFEIPGFSSRYAYREGIRKAWGLPPVDCGRLMNNKQGSAEQREQGECWTERQLNSNSEVRDISFKQLREAYNNSDNKIPFWIINATTPVLNCDDSWYTDISCNWTQFWNTETYPIHKAGFEITPFHWGSGEHGYWRSAQDGSSIDTHGLRVVEAVAAAAAFFDPNEKTLKGGGIINGLQMATGLKWG
jgi:hypothetical protein